MKKHTFVFLSIVFIMNACTVTEKPKTRLNPFFEAFETPFQIPPFESILLSDYIPAFEQALFDQQAEIDAIIKNEAKPDFYNTIEALERSGELLSAVSSVFYNLNGSLTSDSMQQIARQLSPMLSKHSDDIILNDSLFKKIEKLYLMRSEIELNSEEAMLLEKTYKRFIRGGAKLSNIDQEMLRKINEELSLLTLKFGENVLAETNKYQLVVEDGSELIGIPEASLQTAAAAATTIGQEGKWLFTLQQPSLMPVLQYAENRSLREKLHFAYQMRGNNNDALDNKNIISQIVKLRIERAQLLGYKTHADFVLEQNMAKTPETVYNFLHELNQAALPMAKNEAVQLQHMIDRSGKQFKLAPWDWWFYAERLRKEAYDFDESQLRPYFKLENVRDGVFELAKRLYGLKFVAHNEFPKYHPDVQVFEVLEADGTHIGVLYMDFFPRESKRGGAWMSSFRKESRMNGEKLSPIITTNFNFTAPLENQPALLSWDEVLTMFHEFGHALHGLLSTTYYNSLSGTSVPRDFVELPSQIMENWASEPEMLALYAKHYQTDEIIPAELIQKMKASQTFNQGFAMTEFLSAALLDMDWHNLSIPEDMDVESFEKKTLTRAGLIPEIVVRYRSTYFSHIFSGGYSAGYYSYIWSEVLDADAFSVFKEKGLFDKGSADLFRKNILEKGGTADPIELYRAFRGKDPDPNALLMKRGLAKN